MFHKSIFLDRFKCAAVEDGSTSLKHLLLSTDSSSSSFDIRLAVICVDLTKLTSFIDRHIKSHAPQFLRRRRQRLIALSPAAGVTADASHGAPHRRCSNIDRL